MKKILFIFIAFIAILAFISQPAHSAVTSQPVTKVLVFMEENHSLNEMKASMPYTYSLAKQYGYASDWTATTHPSLPNYIAITSGSTHGIAKDGPPSTFPVSGSDVFDQALANSKTAKTYAETMGSNCALTNSGNYAVRHNPWAYYTSGRSNCSKYDVPFSNFSTDVNNGTLPNIGFVIPNLVDDAHNSTLAAADNWFKARMATVFAGPDWTSGHLAVVLVADEDDGSQGNTVLTVVIHPSQSGHVVSTHLTHYSLTRFLEDVVGASHLNNAASAPDMATAFAIPVG